MLLFYEVMTRATRQLFFSYPAVDDSGQPLFPSPYLKEVEQACGAGRIAHSELTDLSPVPPDAEPLSPAEFRLKAVAEAQGQRGAAGGLIQQSGAGGRGSGAGNQELAGAVVPSTAPVPRPPSPFRPPPSALRLARTCLPGCN